MEWLLGNKAGVTTTRVERGIVQDSRIRGFEGLEARLAVLFRSARALSSRLFRVFFLAYVLGQDVSDEG